MKKSLIVVICLAFLLVLGVLVAACGQSSTASNTPKQIVNSWFTNLKNGNWSAAYDQLSAPDKKDITRQQWVDTYTKQGKPPADFAFSVTKEKITGDKAVVDVKISQGGQSETGSIACVKDGNVWKVSATDSQGLNQQ
ncbi:MAG: nuclear transport factor 2 family protein [Candidatus Geothermincolia bacterium]